ncbi:MAG TPA: hypothetical protein VFW70_04950, partial [Methylomirabilota bacterium]|nr:hypothetical protein [Methylomirabilota bacterium]
GQRDFLLCPFLVAGALGVARWTEAPAASGARAALAGGALALGAGMTVKPHALVLAAALGGLVAVIALRTRTGVAASLGVFVAGAATAPAAIVLWLGAAGALPAWRAIVLDYLVPLYSRLGGGHGWTVYRPEVWIPLLAGAVIAAASALAGRRFGVRHAVAAVGVLYGAAHFMGQGKGWEYHLYPLAAFTIVLLFMGAGPALARPRSAPAAALLLCALAAGGLLASKAARTSPAAWERAKAERVRALAGELGALLKAGDTVQVLDTSGGGLHALLRLRVREPTRFLYDFHFFHDTDHPTIRALRAELLRGLDARPPRTIVLFEEGWPAGGYERLDTFVPLRERLAGYDLVRLGPGYRIYAQRHDS